MKLNELLSEDISQLNVFIKLIQRDCGDFLSKVEAPLFRGLNPDSACLQKMGPDILKGKVRSDRRPKDSSPELNSSLNHGIKRHFGINNARGSSLFCSFSISTASNYGTGRPYMIFPIGSVSFLWAPGIADPYASFQDDWGAWNHSVGEYVDHVTNDMDLQDEDGEVVANDAVDVETDGDEVVHRLMDEYADKIFTTNIDGAEHTRNEIMVFCDSYYAISETTLDKHYDVDPHELMKAIQKNL